MRKTATSDDYMFNEFPDTTLISTNLFVQETIVQGNAAEKLNGSNSNNLNSNALGLFSIYKQCLKQGNNNSRAMSGYSPCQMSRHKIHIKKKLKNSLKSGT